MVEPFLRAVESFESLKNEGTSVEFFTGDYYERLPAHFADIVREFSLKNLDVEEISKAQSDGADSLSPFVLRLRDDEALQLFAQFSNLLENKIFECIRSASGRITGSRVVAQPETMKKAAVTRAEADSGTAGTTGANALLSRDLDEHFDALRSACSLRDFLLRLSSFVKRQSKAGNKDAALIVEA